MPFNDSVILPQSWFRQAQISDGSPLIYTHSTPLECKELNTPFSIDMSPLWGEERAEKGSSNA